MRPVASSIASVPTGHKTTRSFTPSGTSTTSLHHQSHNYCHRHRGEAPCPSTPPAQGVRPPPVITPRQHHDNPHHHQLPNERSIPPPPRPRPDSTSSQFEDHKRRHAQRLDVLVDIFLEPQHHDFSRAIAELSHGRKMSHWIWWIFPMMLSSARFHSRSVSQRTFEFRIQSPDVAAAYLKHPSLCRNYIIATNVVAKQLVHLNSIAMQKIEEATAGSGQRQARPVERRTAPTGTLSQRSLSAGVGATSRTKGGTGNSSFLSTLSSALFGGSSQPEVVRSCGAVELMGSSVDVEKLYMSLSTFVLGMHDDPSLRSIVLDVSAQINNSSSSREGSSSPLITGRGTRSWVTVIDVALLELLLSVSLLSSGVPSPIERGSVPDPFLDRGAIEYAIETNLKVGSSSSSTSRSPQADVPDISARACHAGVREAWIAAGGVAP